MQEKRHLNEEQWAAWLLGEASEDERTHVAECEQCGEEAHRVEAGLEGYAESVRAAANRPEAFWAWQQSAIARRLAAGGRESRRLAWATAMALVALLAGTLTREAPKTTPAPDPDHELLVEVERTVRREVPEALQPALLLTQELNRAAESEANGRN